MQDPAATIAEAWRLQSCSVAGAAGVAAGVSAVEGMTAAEEAELRDELQRAIRAAGTSPEGVYRWRLQAVLSGFQDFTWGLKVVLMTTGAAAVIQ